MKKILVTGLLSCSIFSAGAMAKPGPADHRETMNRLARTLTSLLPWVVSATEFEKPANRALILGKTRDLARLAHALRADTKIPDDDPSAAYISRKFEKSLARAQKLLQAGRTRDAQSLLRSTTSYCISCHTRSPAGSFNLDLPAGAQFAFMSPYDKAEYYAAVREIDQATNYYEEVLSSSEFATKMPHRWESAAKKLMAITVRTRENPRLAMELASRIRDKQARNIVLRDNAVRWRDAAKAWLEEGALPAANRADTLARARQLADAGNVLALKHPDAGLIQWLRASAMLHNLLTVRQKDAVEGEALFLAGQVAERLAALNLWTMHEIYYESCVRSQPRTPLAKKCFERFRATQPASDVDDHGNSRYPEDVEELMSELQALTK